jgi:hypothetical protein
MVALLTPGAIAIARTTYMQTMTQRGDVYTRGAIGRYDLLLKAGLACKLTHISATGAGDQRALLLATRRLIWDPAYVMPENTQVVIDGINWRAARGTFATYQAEDGTALYRACDVTRQDV